MTQPTNPADRPVVSALSAPQRAMVKRADAATSAPMGPRDSWVPTARAQSAARPVETSWLTRVLDWGRDLLGISTGTSEPPPGPLPGAARVMTFNIKAAHGSEKLGEATPAERERNLQELAAFIERYDPDVILLQEVEQNFDRNGTYPMFDRLKQLTGATDAAMSLGNIGVAVLTRNGYRIRDRADGENALVTSYLGRSSVMAVPVEPPDGQAAFTVVNAHVNEERLAPLADTYLKRAVEGKLGPDFPQRVLIGGDFNARTTMVHEKLSQAAPVADVFEESGVRLGRTAPRKTSTTPWPLNLFGIHDRDQLHLTEGFAGVTQAQVADPRYPAGHPLAGAPLSDHRPLFSVVKL